MVCRIRVPLPNDPPFVLLTLATRAETDSLAKEARKA